MAVSTQAKIFEKTADPRDRMDWAFKCGKILQTQDGERVDPETVEVSLDAVAVLLGMKLGDGVREVRLEADDETGLPDTMIKFWTEFDSGAWADPAFDGKGAQCPVNVLFETTAQPSRRFERTGIIRVAQL